MMQAIGLCRFSYPALGGFQIKHDTTEDRIAFLYAEARLEERFRLFEHIALPCLRAQTNENWEMIIVIGDSLPKVHADRLRDLVSAMPQITIQVHEPRPQREIMKEILNGARKDPSQPCLQFRYDDDDAVAVDFIARLREAADDCAGLNARHHVVGYDWSVGYAAQFSEQGVVAQQVQYKQYVAALGVHIRGGSKFTIMNFAHTKLDQFMPVVNFADSPMWIESHNGFNDSRASQKRHIPFAPLTDAQVGIFKDRFAINAGQIVTAFAGVSPPPARGIG